MRILISTGIYPPKIGGPAQYSKNLKENFERKGHSVFIATYDRENKLPFGARNVFYFFKILPKVLSADISISMDTFSVAVPTVLAARLFGKKSMIRVGGDFLWEQYAEKHKRKVLLKDFYHTERNRFSLKDKLVFYLTRFALCNASHVVFSTEWQREIFIGAYGLGQGKTSVIENYYGPKESDLEPAGKTFVASSRGIFLKNEELLEEVFAEVPEADLFTAKLPYKEFLEKLASSYAVIAPALSEVSPNLILDAIRYNRPFICTRETGIHDRIKEAGIFIDPLNKGEVEQAVLDLLSEGGYAAAQEKVRDFNFVHTWENIADEFLERIKNI